MATSKYILGFFDQEDQVLDAARRVRASGAQIHDVYSPYPIHGIDEIIGIRRSRLPVVTFLAGLLGSDCDVGGQLVYFGTTKELI